MLSPHTSRRCRPLSANRPPRGADSQADSHWQDASLASGLERAGISFGRRVVYVPFDRAVAPKDGAARLGWLQGKGMVRL